LSTKAVIVGKSGFMDRGLG